MRTKGREPKSATQTACLPCRRRKSRCKYEPGSQACLMCRAHENECVTAPRFSPRSPPTPRTRAQAAAHRTRRTFDAGVARVVNSASQSRAEGEPRTELGISPTETPPADVNGLIPPFSAPSTPLCLDSAPTSKSQPQPLDEAEEDDSPHIMGPAVASDRHFFHDYLSTSRAGDGARTIRPVLPGITSSPVVFTRVPKRPVGLPVDLSPSRIKLQTIEKLLEPHQKHVINMYFAKANSCLPILDESSFDPSFVADGRVSPVVMACLYAHSLIYWSGDPELSRHHCPDSRFIWNLALESLHSELHLSPGLPSIVAILLNVSGRPTTTMIGNGMLLGCAVSLAYSLGLNRNPTVWDIPVQEKALRVRIWWCLVIHDRWASLMYGTPPHIRQDYYDVPPLTASLNNNSETKVEVFEALASLTSLLGPYLAEIYSISGASTDQAKRAPCRLNLDAWIDTLPARIRRIIIRGTNLDTPGAANLRLCFLAAKFFSRRLDLSAEVESMVPGQPADVRLLEVRRIVEEVVLFVYELSGRQLGDFWLPTNAFVFSSAVMFLIRLAVQSEIPTSGSAQSLSLSLAVDLIASLRACKENHGWELGDVCLTQYGEAVDRLSAEENSVQQNGATDVPVPPFITDPAFLDSIISDQWDPLLWGPMA